jgi:hypothetical protein
MVEVRVRQDDGIQILEGAFLRQVILVLGFPRSLKQTQVQKDVGLAGLHQVSRPRDLASARPVNCDLHIQLVLGYPA